jgi:hypothetical protein
MNENLRWISGFGQLLSFDDSGKQPSERLLYFASCQRANAHNSARAVDRRKSLVLVIVRF